MLRIAQKPLSKVPTGSQWQVGRGEYLYSHPGQKGIEPRVCSPPGSRLCFSGRKPPPFAVYPSLLVADDLRPVDVIHQFNGPVEGGIL